MLDEAESKIFAIAEEGSRGAQGFQEIQPLLTQVVERIDELYSRDSNSDITGVPTGFADLDRMTSGLQPGDLIVEVNRNEVSTVEKFMQMTKGQERVLLKIDRDGVYMIVALVR